MYMPGRRLAALCVLCATMLSIILVLGCSNAYAPVPHLRNSSHPVIIVKYLQSQNSNYGRYQFVIATRDELDFYDPD
ncbi:MAG: hypothetical protein JRJ12_13345 [Deltaproteobacteria bacterium]|nr:hypothetical protein [Deltaproteobacteria bacterium]MBW2071997.1 hypothetical protein [Deltaproteobacteria bacterium]